MKNLSFFVLAILLSVLTFSCSPESADVKINDKDENVSSIETFSPYYDKDRLRQRRPN